MTPAKDPGQKGAEMAINREKDHKGQSRIVVSKYWPDGSRFRRYIPNMTVAKKTMARIEESIAMGTWPALKAELSRGTREEITVKGFAETLPVPQQPHRGFQKISGPRLFGVDHVRRHARLSADDAQSQCRAGAG